MCVFADLTTRIAQSKMQSVHALSKFYDGQHLKLVCLDLFWLFTFLDVPPKRKKPRHTCVSGNTGQICASSKHTRFGSDGAGELADGRH